MGENGTRVERVERVEVKYFEKEMEYFMEYGGVWSLISKRIIMKSKIEKFEDLRIWKEGMSLAVEIYTELKTCRDFGLKDQMQRSAVSVPSNIAEGFERRYQKDFVRFLNIANGSNGELRTQLLIAVQIGLIEKEKGMKLIERTKFISAMIYKLIIYRKGYKG